MNQKKIISFLTLTFVLFFSNPGFSEEGLNDGQLWQRFSESDPSSKTRIDHQALTDMLKKTVFVVGNSRGFLGNEKPAQYINSKINITQSLTPSRFEGNRLFVHDFTDYHIDFFRDYKTGLENLSERRALGTFNKGEQLAYWLNLYNVIVINKLVDEYPIQTLKPLRSSKSGNKSFWDEKVTTVGGVPLSLRDIEKILFNNFNSPLVAFGLWQGSIGGPKLQNQAYTKKNVWRLLENNAVEFVNSNRGLRPPRGSRMKVSQFYQWVLPAFGTSEDHVLMFIREYGPQELQIRE